MTLLQFKPAKQTAKEWFRIDSGIIVLEGLVEEDKSLTLEIRSFNKLIAAINLDYKHVSELRNWLNKIERE